MGGAFSASRDRQTVRIGVSDSGAVTRMPRAFEKGSLLMHQSIFRGTITIGAAALILVALSTPPASAGFCCVDPTQQCNQDSDCDAAQCGPPCPGQFDHLKCYKIKDPLKLRGRVDLFSPQFGPEDCRIHKAKLFCVPASKRVVNAFDDSQPIDPLAVFGPPAPGDRICYQIKCRKPYPPDQLVTDQFGTRVIEELRPDLLCTPAYKGMPPPLCGRQADGTCGGDCPSPNDQCLDDGINCRCLPSEPECSLDPNGICGGNCPLPTQECRQTPGAIDCDCFDVPQPCSLDPNGTCGGTCPLSSQVCRGDATGQCDCFDVPQPCSLDPNGICGGICPSPSQECRQTPGAIDCDCFDVPQPCSLDPNGTCGGTCPLSSQVCRGDATGQCDCFDIPQPCSLGPNGTCGGACPGTSQQCLQIPGALECDCFDIPQGCDVQADGTCGGPCPFLNQECRGNAIGECDCFDIPQGCDVQPDGTCGGPCPFLNQECRGNAIGECECFDIPQTCGRDPATGICGGTCPNAAQQCKQIPGALNCRCVGNGVPDVVGKRPLNRGRR